MLESMGFSWSLFLAQNFNEEKVRLSPSLRRVSSDTNTQMMHDRGPPLVFVAGQQGHGGAYVFVDTLGTICDHVALSHKMVSEWSDIFERLGLGEALGTELDGRELFSRVTSKRFWMMRQGSRHSCVQDDVAAEHWSVSSAVVPSHLLLVHSFPLLRKRSNLE